MRKPTGAQAVGTIIGASELSALTWTFATYEVSWELAVCVAIFGVVNVLAAYYQPTTAPKQPEPPQHWTGPFVSPERELTVLTASEYAAFMRYLDEERAQTNRLLSQGDGVA